MVASELYEEFVLSYRFDEFEVLIFIMQFNTIKGLFIPMALDVNIFSRDY